MQCFVIKGWSLVYWEVSKDKIVNEYKFSGILLDDD